MIAETGARGVLGTVTAVKTQQSEIDSPLDDLVIDCRLSDGTPIDSCARQAIPLSTVRVSPDLGEDLARQLEPTSGAYEGVPVITEPELSSRVEFYRFKSGERDQPA